MFHHWNEGVLPRENHGRSIPLHVLARYDTEVAHHYVAEPPPDETHGVWIGISKEERNVAARYRE